MNETVLGEVGSSKCIASCGRFPSSLADPARTIFALIIINKAGGLIFNRSFHEGGLNKLNTNDYLVLAGTFHG
jgi:hypothetical protein